MKKQFEALGRDLFFKTKCECPSELFKGTDIEHIMTHTLTVTGYADSHFFDTVNKEPREGNCKCGRKYKYQWFRDGVDFEWLEPYTKE